MEVKGYRVKAESKQFSLYEVDGILDYLEHLNGDEVMAIESSGEEYVIVHFFVREDGEQLNLDIDIV